jgi:4-alpha-glucanotransferase
MAEPVNIPGTSYQYKNWRRKLSVRLRRCLPMTGEQAD